MEMRRQVTVSWDSGGSDEAPPKVRNYDTTLVFVQFVCVFISGVCVYSQNILSLICGHLELVLYCCYLLFVEAVVGIKVLKLMT